MEASNWIAVAAATLAAASALFAWRQARASEEQTEIQRTLREDAVSPRLWADIKPDDSQGTLLRFHIGNAGPTTATSVRIVVTPGLPSIASKREAIDRLQAVLAHGLSSLPPGREHAWILGQGFELLKGDGPDPIVVRIDANGPFGALSTQEYVINPVEWKDSHDQPSGSLHQVRKAIDGLKKSLE